MYVIRCPARRLLEEGWDPYEKTKPTISRLVPKALRDIACTPGDVAAALGDDYLHDWCVLLRPTWRLSNELAMESRETFDGFEKMYARV